jgi:hypothetical protein
MASYRRSLVLVNPTNPTNAERTVRDVEVAARAASRRVQIAVPEWVRTIFRRYLELGSLNHLMADLRARGIVTKMRSLKLRGLRGPADDCWLDLAG